MWEKRGPMSKPIRILPPAVAEKIAAGEVIERPASIVKELLENAIDAGATRIQVRLEDGGKQLIEVTDNGHGMSEDDLGRCMARHATSKLATLDDLDHILTLGFRGEALPSIGAVSELSILTRDESSSKSSVAFLNLGGRVERATHGEFLGTPHGTRVQARGLFATFPARLKFLRASASEVSAVRDWMERLSLSRPEISFTLLSGQKELLRLKATTEAERVREVLADGEDFPIQVAEADGIRAYWIQGLSSPYLRKIAQILNGRSIRDRAIQQAVLAPFRQALLPGQFPALAIYLDLPTDEVDVNVHPTKAEVRFLRSSDIYHRVSKAIEAMIDHHGAPGFVNQGAGAFSPSLQPTLSAAEPLWNTSPHYAANSLGSPSSPSPPFNFPTSNSNSNSNSTQTATATVDSNSPSPLPSPLDSLEQRYIGRLFSTYLAFDQGTELLLIDQHAAHERVRYEQLRTAHAGAGSQALLLPEVVTLRADDRARIEARLPELAALGFEAETFGDERLLFRAIPWATSTGESEELKTRLKNLVDRLANLPASASVTTALIDEVSFETLASRACRSSVRAGDRLEPAQAIALHRDLFACEHPWNCPHGRPTTVKIPRARFEEWFQRRV